VFDQILVFEYKDLFPVSSNIPHREFLFKMCPNILPLRAQTELETSNINISVFDANFLRNELIGSYIFDISNIYYMKNHELYK